MVKVKIHEIAKELGMKSKDVVEKAKEIEIDAKVAGSIISGEDAQNLMTYVMSGTKPSKNIKESQKITPKVIKDEPTQPKDDGEQKIAKEQKSSDVPKEKDKEMKTPDNLKEKKEQIKPKATELSTSTSLKTRPKVGGMNHLKRRRGLVIVRKRKPKTPPTIEKPNLKGSQNQSLKSLMSSGSDDLNRRRRKVKKTPAIKQDNTKKANFEIGGGSFMDISIDSDSNYSQQIMPDINIVEIAKDDTQKKKKILDNTRARAGKSSKFTQQKRSIKRKKLSKKVKKKKEEIVVTHVEIPEEIRLYEFAEKINRGSAETIGVLFKLGLIVTRNDFLDKDAIEVLADEFEVEVKFVNALKVLDEMAEAHKDELSALEDDGGEERPPVITIMGHVDHGKTSLLDKIRESEVASSEHGGITQHIGAYMVHKNDKRITFLDTPGHEAFTEMRARGTSVTDIVIIVVAADDGVMPQTKEAIDHAKEAKVPVIVAVTKVDKANANPDLVKSQMAEYDLSPVEWGGDTEFVNISSHTGEGIDEILELILIQSEVLELRANPDASAKATVIESSTAKGRGAIATVIAQNGTIRVGNNIVCGIAHGRVKALLDENGHNLTAIHPGEPGVVVGLSQVPHTGENLFKVDNPKIAKELAKKKADHLRTIELSRTTKVTLEELNEKIAEGQLKSLPVILKADVAGSLEAVKGKLEKLRNDQVKVNVISSGVGGITEGDLALADASENSVILGYHIRPTGLVKRKAKELGIEINTYNIIYDLEQDVRNLLGGMLSPIEREEDLGQAQVREVFRVPKLGAIAGCMVTEGVINRGVGVRVIRDGVIVYEGEISSLKRFKDDVKEVGRGYECGIGVVGYSDIKEGDFLESFKVVLEQAKLEIKEEKKD